MFQKAQSPVAASGRSAIVPPQAPDETRVSEVLLQDILDIEGPLRMTMSEHGPAGFGADRIAADIERLSAHLPDGVAAQLRSQVRSLRRASGRDDAAQVCAAHAGLVDTLHRLRMDIDANVNHRQNR